MLASYFNMDPEKFNWYILPIIIFFSRITDVTLGTFRIILITKGRRRLAPICGFFEVLIWITVISQILQNINNIACYIAWAGGFACGNYVGLLIEEKVALGKVILRIITNQSPGHFLHELRERGLNYTLTNGHGSRGPVEIIFSVIERKNRKLVESLISTHIPSSFYSVSDVRSATDNDPVNGTELSRIRRFFNLGRRK